jgi:hypothetical protein
MSEGETLLIGDEIEVRSPDFRSWLPAVVESVADETYRGEPVRARYTGKSWTTHCFLPADALRRLPAIVRRRS